MGRVVLLPNQVLATTYRLSGQGEEQGIIKVQVLMKDAAGTELSPTPCFVCGMPSIAIVWAIVWAIVVTLCMAAVVARAQSQDPAVVQALATQPEAVVECVDDRISVNAYDIELMTLMHQVADTCAIGVVFSGAVERRVNLRIVDEAIVQGLRQLLQAEDFVIEDMRLEQSGERRILVRVIAAGRSAAPVGVLNTTTASLPSLHRDLKSPDPSVRVRAIDTLESSGNPQALALLTPLLVDTDEEVRAVALQAITVIGGDGAARAIATALTDSRASVRFAALAALGEMEQQGIAALVAPALVDADDEVRDEAFELVMQNGGEAAVSALETPLRDPRAVVRMQAVDNLAAINTARATALLRQALADEDESIRDIAADVLESRGEKTGNAN